jgi:hypothetical protein
MNLKTIKIISIINIFILSFPIHFAYNFMRNIIASIIFPVNESIFEHMKIIFTATLINGIIDYILIKINKIEVNNFLFQLFYTSFIGIPIFLIIYLPENFFIGEYLILTILLLFITYIITGIISYYLLKSKSMPLLNIISIPLIIIIYSIFTYLTYNPPKNYLFYDTLKQSYGIPK